MKVLKIFSFSFVLAIMLAFLAQRFTNTTPENTFISVANEEWDDNSTTHYDNA
jgi:hypothetical protein